jgi:undecaprenyl-phosphate galactose phosphotransferase
MQPNPDDPRWVLEVPEPVVTVPDLDVEVHQAPPPGGRPNGSRVYEASKRIFDLAVVVALSPIWLPIYGVIALAILAIDGRPIHFKDPRVGRGGRDLSVIKFRTMHASAKSDLEALLATKPELRAEFSRFAKLKTDPRITAIGQFLRRLSLDELPQLFCVLKGDMSLVGPRPLARWELERFYSGAMGLVLSIPPGLTGLWQICGRSALSLEERVPLDVRYVTERGFLLDLSILLRTVPVVLRGSGAV